MLQINIIKLVKYTIISAFSLTLAFPLLANAQTSEYQIDILSSELAMTITEEKQFTLHQTTNQQSIENNITLNNEGSVDGSLKAQVLDMDSLLNLKDSFTNFPEKNDIRIRIGEKYFKTTESTIEDIVTPGDTYTFNQIIEIGPNTDAGSYSFKIKWSLNAI